MTGCVDFEQTGAWAQVTLRHPKRFNAMSRVMWRQLRAVFQEIQGSTTLRGVLVTGAGGHFCAGGDISEYASFRFQEDTLRDFHEHDVWGALSAMLACDVPVVARIAGHCMGAGVEIASCCDIRLAAESAQFGAPIARLGFPMAPREAALVLREAGAVVTRAMLLEAAVFNAPELAARGYLTRVVADDDLAAVTAATMVRVVAGAPQAARLNKKTLRTLFSSFTHTEPASSAIDGVAKRSADTADTMAHLLAHAYAYADSAEHREGVSAFLAKRKPVF